MTQTDPNLAAPPRSIEPRKPYRIRSAETWDLVRTHYLRGETARALSERYGVSVSNIRRKAGDEGWTRKGHAEAVDHFRVDGPPAPVSVSQRGAAGRMAGGATGEATGEAAGEATGRLSVGGFADPHPQGPEAAPLDPFDGEPEAVKTLALAAAARALRAGRYADAERLGRLAETLTRLSPAPEAVAVAAAAAADEEEEAPEAARGQAYLHMPLDYDTGGHDRQKVSLILGHLIEVAVLQLRAKDHEAFERFYGEIRQEAQFLGKIMREGAPP
jgi:hypothetical protein